MVEGFKVLDLRFRGLELRASGLEFSIEAGAAFGVFTALAFLKSLHPVGHLMRASESTLNLTA